MKDEDIYKKANKKVKAKKGFMYHLIAYVLVLTMLYAIIRSENNGDILPVIIVGCAWGIGLATHYFSTFGTENLDWLGVNENWEEDELANEVAKLKRKRELRESLAKEKKLLAESEKIDFDDLDPLELKEIEKRYLDRDKA